MAAILSMVVQIGYVLHLRIVIFYVFLSLNQKLLIMKSTMTFRFFLVLFGSASLLACHNASMQPNDGPPKGYIISVEQAQQMYDAYSQRRVPIIQQYEDSLVSDGSKFEPTRYAEYDLETIKQYISYIEQEAAQAKVNINTLRFYLANYPNSTTFPNGVAVKYPKRNTFFVVPTMEYKGINVGFSIKEENGKYTAVPLSETTRNTERAQDRVKIDSNAHMSQAGFFVMNDTISPGGGTTSLILNDGQVAPPPPTVDFGNN